MLDLIGACGEFEFACTITLVIHEHQLTKCDSHSKL